jgi:hypothetical protein
MFSPELQVPSAAYSLITHTIDDRAGQSVYLSVCLNNVKGVVVKVVDVCG